MKVVIPPDILDLEESSNRLTSLEGGSVRLGCRASGRPEPGITWRREDGRGIVIRRDNERALVAQTYKNENLLLNGILRQEMGSYLCIASNGVPPTVSKRYYVNVLFKPTIKLKSQIVFAHINHDVTLECYIESSPKSFTVWYTENGLKMVFDERHTMSEAAVNDYTFQVNLTIRRIRSSDFNIYTCLTENSLGKANADIRLREQRIGKTAATPIHFPSDKIPVMSNALEKRRRTFNNLGPSNNLLELDSGRLVTSLLDNRTSLVRNNEEYRNFAKAPGAHYGSTDFPGSYHLNTARSTIAEKRTVKIIITFIAALHAIFA